MWTSYFLAFNVYSLVFRVFAGHGMCARSEWYTHTVPELVWVRAFQSTRDDMLLVRIKDEYWDT